MAVFVVVVEQRGCGVVAKNKIEEPAPLVAVHDFGANVLFVILALVLVASAAVVVEPCDRERLPVVSVAYLDAMVVVVAERVAWHFSPQTNHSTGKPAM